MSWADEQAERDLAQQAAARREQEIVLQRQQLIEPRKGRFWIGVYGALAAEVEKYNQKFPHRSVVPLTLDRPDPETIDLRDDPSSQCLRATLDVDGVLLLDPRTGKIVDLLPFQPTITGLRTRRDRKYLTETETAAIILGCLVALRS